MADESLDAVTAGGDWSDPRARAALYGRAVAALERSAALAEQHAERQQASGRSRDAEQEYERARRARRMVARARSILR
jgi:hypothetical protein